MRLSREQVWCPIYGTGRRRKQVCFPGSGTGLKNGEVIGVLQTRLEPWPSRNRFLEASAFTRSSTLIVRRDGTILPVRITTVVIYPQGTCLIR